AGEDGVGGVSNLLDMGAGALAGDPAGVVFGGGDFAIESEGGLQGHQRLAGPHEMEEGLVQLFGFGLELIRHLDGNAGGAQTAEALAGDERIRVARRRYYFRDARRDHGIGARPGAAGMGARFERDVESGAASALAGFFQREN